jgi:hypothetical protein
MLLRSSRQLRFNIGDDLVSPAAESGAVTASNVSGIQSNRGVYTLPSAAFVKHADCQ